MSSYDEERIARLIGSLPPAPSSWIQAAQELPLARRGLDELVARAEADAEFRRACLADLEAAVAEAGYRLDSRLLTALRARLVSVEPPPPPR